MNRPLTSRRKISARFSLDLEEEDTGGLDLGFIDEHQTREIMEKALKLYFHAEKAKEPNKCTLCSAPATKACGVCLTDYCSEQCQNKDWPLHQKYCNQLRSIVRESAVNSQNNPPSNQNPATMPSLERSKDSPNINHDFSKRRDPRLQRRGPPQLRPHQNPVARNVEVQQPRNPHPQTDRSFPPPRLDNIPPRQFTRPTPHPRPSPRHNVEVNFERPDPRLSNRSKFPSQEPVQNIVRGVDPQENLEHQIRVNQSLVNNNSSDSNDLFHRRPDRRPDPRLTRTVTDPNSNIFGRQPEFNAQSGRGESLPDYETWRESPVEDSRMPEHSIDNRGIQGFATESRGISNPPGENRKMFGFSVDNRRMSGHPVDNRGMSGPSVGNRRMSGPPVDNRRMSGPPVDNRGMSGPPVASRRMPGTPIDSRRIPGPSFENRNRPAENIRRHISPTENRRRQDSPMEITPTESPVRMDPTIGTPRIRVKSLDSLKEVPTPKVSEKVASKFIHSVDRESFSNIFRPSTDQIMEGLNDLEDIGDLDDVDMDSGLPERLNVIGMLREENDKYWVIREINFTMYETMQEEVQKCSLHRSIRPVIGTIGACLYEDEWFRGKVVRVRPNVKIHYIDFGNSSTYNGEIKELPGKLTQVEPLAFLIQFSESTPIKYLTKDLDGRKFEIEIIEKLENGVSLVRIPQKERKINKPEVIPSLPNFSKKHPVIMCGFSVNEVYVRPVDECSKLNFENLEEELEIHCTQERSYIVPPAPGELVCARCDVNETYYRAEVLHVEEDLIRVYFVDYGAEQETLLKYLKPLRQDLKERQAFVVKVKLVGVPTDHVPLEVSTYYNRLISRKVDLIMSYEDGTDGVILSEEATGIVVNDQVSKMILDQIKKSELLLEDSLKFISLNTGDIKKLIISFIDKEEFYDKTIFYVTDPENEYYDFVNERLASEISVYCNKETMSFAPELKELCLAQFEGDWYRGINLECVDDTSCRIFFIDYGNESIVAKRCIRRMPKEFADPPCLAVRASIADSKKLVNNKKLNDDIFEYLESNVSRTLALVEVVEVIEDGLSSLCTLRFPEIDRVLSAQDKRK